MNVRITKIHPDAVIPTYGSSGAAAFDFTSVAEATILPHTQALVPTGLVFAVPADHVLLVFSRSSTFAKLGLIIANGVGVIDPDYSGPADELKVIMMNPGDTPVTIPAGTRVAQGMIIHRPGITFVEGAADGASRGGFGTTGGYGS